MFLLLLLVVNLASSFPILWCGAVTSNSISFRALGYSGHSFRLSLLPGLEFPGYQQRITVDIAEIYVSNLISNQRYYYGVDEETNGTLVTGTFRTLPDPAAGSSNFTIAFGASTSSQSNSAVFKEILKHPLSFFIHMGDLFMDDISDNNVTLFLDSFHRMFDQPNQRRLFSGFPIAYMFHSRDYTSSPLLGGEAPNREAARQAYQQAFPHYPLVAGHGNVPLYQAYTVGTVRFLQLDLSSEAIANDDGGVTLLSSAQWAWLEGELNQAGRYTLVVIVSTKAWIGGTGDVATWGYWPAERKRLADAVANRRITNLMMLTGGRSLALDEGTNSDYSTNGGAGFPVVQSSPLDYWGSAKGGPYSHGCRAYQCDYNEQYATMEVTYPVNATGTSTCVSIKGIGGGAVVLSWEKCTPFVVKGSAGDGSCSISLMPAWTWVAYVFSGIFTIAISIVCFVGVKYFFGDETSKVTLVVIAYLIYIIFAALSVALFPVVYLLEASDTIRPAFLPVHLSLLLLSSCVLFSFALSLVWSGQNEKESDKGVERVI